jgi:hypothetical protein
MNCTFCDAALSHTARFCPNCGGAVANPPPADPYPMGKGGVYAAPGDPYSYGPTSSPSTSTLALVSLVAGILTWFAVPVLGAIAAVITGHMARREIRDSQGHVGGDALAVVGLILGYLQLALILVVVVFVIAAVTLGIAMHFR